MSLLRKLAVVVVVTVYASVARADLIEVDFLVADDGLLTVDTDTGMEWLDIPLTHGLTYNEAEISPFVILDGFRHASLAEVVDLLGAFGVTYFDGVRRSENSPGARKFVNMMGPGIDFGTLFGLEGWASDGHMAALISVDTNKQVGIDENGRARVTRGIDRNYSDINDIYRGNFLVRNIIVPEPGTLALLGIGLFGMGLSRRRKKA